MLQSILSSSHKGHARGTDKLLDGILGVLSTRITDLAGGETRIKEETIDQTTL